MRWDAIDYWLRWTGSHLAGLAWTTILMRLPAEIVSWFFHRDDQTWLWLCSLVLAVVFFGRWCAVGADQFVTKTSPPRAQ
mgnify:CR=1 FL=1